jgi:hypothetical protein
MKSQKGFVTVMFLALLPVLITAGLGVMFCFSFLKTDMAILNVCRSEQLAVQNKVGRDLEKLLAMNPRALKLRADEAAARIKLQAASASGIPPAIAAAEARLLYVQLTRQDLAFRQKVLIQSANLKFTQGALQVSRSLQQEWQEQTSRVSPWLNLSFRLNPPQVPKLSVRPDLPDAAPAYETVPQFEEVQSWAHSWQIQFRGKDWLKNFPNFGGRFQRSCATSLYSRNPEWIGKLKKDRFL